jgi:peptidoglycan/xylan/chitin deacetylase (PgdA/CDA1 family)
MTIRFRPLVLALHAVSNSWPYLLAVSPEMLERQLKSLLLRRYRPATAAEAVGGRGRLLHVTFDDGFRSTLNALPLLERLGIPSTVFVCPAWADRGRLSVPELDEESRKFPRELATLDWDQLRKLRDCGVEIGSHTLTHPHLRRLTDIELARELRESRERLESELERPCRFLSYPFGENDERVRAAARDAGYVGAFGLPEKQKPCEPFAVPRIGFYRQDGMIRATLKTSVVRQPVAAFRRAQDRAERARSERSHLEP